MNTFKVGQSVVHISYGIGVIKGIEEREFTAGKVDKFYILEVQDSGVPKKCFVPLGSADSKLRNIISKKTALKVLDYIEVGETTVDGGETWNRRYRNYMELIHTGDAMQIASVYVALMNAKKNNDLSFGERKLLDHAKTLLSKELNAAGVYLPER